MKAKNVLLAMAILLVTGVCTTIQAQNVQVGSDLVLGTPDAHGYDYVKFPKKNFIMKRGSIANFNQLEGMPVVVRDIMDKDGITYVTLERRDGQKFFRFYRTVTARLDKAMESGELSRS